MDPAFSGPMSERNSPTMIFILSFFYVVFRFPLLKLCICVFFSFLFIYILDDADASGAGFLGKTIPVINSDARPPGRKRQITMQWRQNPFHCQNNAPRDNFKGKPWLYFVKNTNRFCSWKSSKIYTETKWENLQCIFKVQKFGTGSVEHLYI